MLFIIGKVFMIKTIVNGFKRHIYFFFLNDLHTYNAKQKNIFGGVQNEI